MKCERAASVSTHSYCMLGLFNALSLAEPYPMQVQMFSLDLITLAGCIISLHTIQ